MMERKEGEGERRDAGKGTGGEVFPYFILLTHTHTTTSYFPHLPSPSSSLVNIRGPRSAVKNEKEI